VEQLRTLVQKHTQDRQFGFLGEARVNVLELNLELDERFPTKKQASIQ
jgi:potassium-transporting ATPase KdpC subunit